MRIVKVSPDQINGIVVNIIQANSILPGFKESSNPNVNIGWIWLGGTSFQAPDPQPIVLSEYKQEALNQIENSKNNTLSNLINNGIGGPTLIATLIRFQACEAQDAGIASTGQQNLILNETGHTGEAPAPFATNLATNFETFQGKIGHVFGISRVAKNGINAATSIAEVNQALDAAKAAWQAL